MGENIVKCEIILDRIFYPKNARKVEAGEYAIFTGTIVKNIDNAPNTQNIKLKGNVPLLEYATTYKVFAKLAEHHEIYGDTYEIIYISKKIDISSKEKQMEFLSNVLPESTIDRLFEQYDDVLTLLEDRDIESLCKVKGIKEASAQRIIDEYNSIKDYSSMYTELGKLGLTYNLIKKITEYYKSPDVAVETIKKNPYDLVKVDGIGFKKADEIGMKMGIGKFDCRRIKEFLLYTLSEQGEMGKSYLHYQELMKILYDTLGFVPEECVMKTAQMMVDNNDVVVLNDGENIALTKYYNLENNIKNELIRLLNKEPDDRQREDVVPYVPKDFKIDNADESISEVEKEQGYTFTEEQREALYTCLNNQVVAITGGAGCVDGDTEYFNGRKWKKISEFTDGEQILQYNSDGTASLVYPSAYIKQKSDYLWHFETKYGLDQCLSDNHNCYYITSKGNLYHKTFKEIRENHEKTGFKGQFITTFDYCGQGIPLTDDEIRLMVATFADATFAYNNSEFKNNSNIYNKARFNLKKERKKERLISIINNLGYDYSISKSSIEGYDTVSVRVPFRCKHFPENWYNCNKHQLEIIADEVVYWDSDYKEKNHFSTTNKSDADYIQFVWTALGYRSTININDRVGEEYLTNDKTYQRKSIEYTVNWTKRNLVGMCTDKRKDHTKTPINKYKTKDGFEYCFTVPSHMLVLRRNNKIFITGNCGKTSTASGICRIFKDYEILAVALSGKAAVRITEATGLPASTIHRGLQWTAGYFLYDKYNKAPFDIVLIDEATMINGTLFLSLLEAIPSGAKVIIMGDVQQLTSIGNCQVFSDILNSGVVPTVRLTKPHRQALRSGIIPTSIKVANQEQLFDNNFEGFQIIGELQDMELNITKDKGDLSDFVVEKFKQEYDKIGEIEEVQVIAPLKTKGNISCYTLNTKIQQYYNPISENDDTIEIVLSKSKDDKKSYKIKVGDKVINTKNNYKSLNVDGDICPIYNGNIGIVKSINSKGCIVDFIGIGEIFLNSQGSKKLELGYAISIHKSQGSGFKSTIIALDNSSYIMNNAELLYTAITRAKKYCVLVANNQAVRMTIKKKEINTKQTFLKDMLLENIK